MKNGAKDRYVNTTATEQEIVDLFWQREERALEYVEVQFGRLLFTVCFGILNNSQDSEECVNSVYEKLWNSIPPARPSSLKAYAVKIAQRISLNKFKFDRRKKRINSSMTESLDDFAEFLSDDYSVEDIVENSELSKILSEFIHALPREQQCVFVKRYYYSQSVSSISKETGYNTSFIKKQLKDVKEKLKSELEERSLI